MILRQECIGQKVRATAPNGIGLTLTINESEKELYRKLGLDVFEKEPVKPKAKVEEVVLTNEKVVDTLTEMWTKPNKKNGRSTASKANQ